ncbi:hypothetical protein FRC06_002303, partial [Ceratobasidium sp. 370]
MPAARTNTNHSSRPDSDTDTLAVQARRLVRIVDMWWPGNDVVATGKEMESMTDNAILDLRENANKSVVTNFIVNGIPAMAPECWGRFMWAKGQYDPRRPSAGLLEGELLFSAATAILFSPSSSMPSTIEASGGARGHIRRRGPIGIAKKYELTQVTPGFIAYVACITRHALTAEDQFSEVCGGFSYIRFYYLVREFLENPKYERWTTALIERWNEKLFSGYEFGLNAVAAIDQASMTLNMLDAELEGMEIAPEDLGLG